MEPGTAEPGTASEAPATAGPGQAGGYSTKASHAVGTYASRAPRQGQHQDSGRRKPWTGTVAAVRQTGRRFPEQLPELRRRPWRGRDKDVRKTKPLILLAAAALNAALLSGCAEDAPVEEAREGSPAAEAAILGETVIIESEVAKVVGPNVFIVGEDTLVLAADMTGQLEEGDNVQITGTVRTFIQTDIEPEHGIDLNKEEESATVNYEEQLAVVAQEVQELP